MSSTKHITLKVRFGEPVDVRGIQWGRYLERGFVCLERNDAIIGEPKKVHVNGDEVSVEVLFFSNAPRGLLGPRHRRLVLSAEGPVLGRTEDGTVTTLRITRLTLGPKI